LYADVHIREEHAAYILKVEMYRFRNRHGYVGKLEGGQTYGPREGHKEERN
jgi:hypothetical protein